MSGARILLVEDDEVLSNLLARNLEARRHRVQLARDAQSALALLHTAAFDLIVLDICLPDQTGWEILRTAQREKLLVVQSVDGETPHLPVVVLSAVRASLSRLAEFHPLAYLPKPFPMDAVLRLAAEAAQRSEARTDLSEQPNDQAIASFPPGESFPHRPVIRPSATTIDEEESRA